MVDSQICLFVSTNDTSSLMALLNIYSTYDQEIDLVFDKAGFNIDLMTKDRLATISTTIIERNLLRYHYIEEEEQETKYVSVRVKSLLTNLKSISNKRTGQFYMFDNNTEIFINDEGTNSMDGATIVETLEKSIDPIGDVNINCDPNDYIKLSTTDFSQAVDTIIKLHCKIVKFKKNKTTLSIEGYVNKKKKKDGDKDDMTCITTRNFSDSFPFSNDEVTEEEQDEEEEYQKKGKLNIKIKRTKVVSVGVDKVKGLQKISTVCKSGLVYIYFGHIFDKKHGQVPVIMFKVCVNQLGDLTIKLKDNKACE